MITRIKEPKFQVVYNGKSYKFTKLEIHQLQLDIALGKVDHNKVYIKKPLEFAGFKKVTINPNTGNLSDTLGKDFMLESEIQFKLMKTIGQQ